MRATVLIAVAAAAALTAPRAWADDQADCLKGIEAIKAEIAKNPPKPVLDRLTRALRIAEREKGEQEWDECVDAVKDAQKVLHR